MISSVPSLAPVTSPSSSSSGDGTGALLDAARGFEAMFLRQVLAAARATSLAGEDDPLAGGSAAATFTEMRDSHFADIAAKTGAIGFAKTLAGQLARQNADAKAS